MPKFEVTLIVNVYAHRDVIVEAEGPEEAGQIALAEDRELHKAGAGLHGVAYDVEWSEREDPEINEIREVV